MRKAIFPLLGLAVFSVGSIRADSFNVSADIFGDPAVMGSCSSTPSCFIGNEQTGPYAETGVQISTSSKQISVQGTMNFNPAGSSYTQGDITGTITLPSTWDKVDVTYILSAATYGVSPDVVISGTFTGLPFQSGEMTEFQLNPDANNQISVIAEAESVTTDPYG